MMEFKKNKFFEFAFGFLTLFLIFFLCFYFFNKNYNNKIEYNKNYRIYYAAFDDVDGLYKDSDVKIAGVNVGKIEDIFINENFQAVTKIKVFEKFKISADSMIIVATVGFLGGKYLKITPGYEEKYLNNNDYFEFTQSTVSIEGLISLLKK